jgi:hypothetical protein
MSTTTTKDKRGERIVLATDSTGREIFVKLKASGISPLVAMIDGLSLTFFGKSETPYLKVTTELEWFEKELPHDPGNKDYQTAIAAYRRILEKFQAGEIHFS